MDGWMSGGQQAEIDGILSCDKEEEDCIFNQWQENKSSDKLLKYKNMYVRHTHLKSKIRRLQLGKSFILPNGGRMWII